jgi:adenylate kinase
MIIGLLGAKGSGKSTIAEHLERNYGFKRVNFKDSLLEEVRERFPDLLRLMSEEENLSVDEMFKLKPPMVRALLQNYGTEVKRADDQNYWVKRWEKIADHIEDNIVVDDVRFLNEVSVIANREGVLIRAIVDGEKNADKHSSETALDNFKPDFTISAVRGAREQLIKQVESILETIKNNND